MPTHRVGRDRGRAHTTAADDQAATGVAQLIVTAVHKLPSHPPSTIMFSSPSAVFNPVTDQTSTAHPMAQGLTVRISCPRRIPESCHLAGEEPRAARTR